MRHEPRRILQILQILLIVFSIFLTSCSASNTKDSSPTDENAPSVLPEEEMPGSDISKEGLKASRVRLTAVPEGVITYNAVEVYIGDTPLPLYNVKTNESQRWNGNTQTRIDTAVGYFELEGFAEVTVKLPYEIDYSSQVRPLSAGIIPIADIDNRTLTFTIRSAGSYVIEPNNDKSNAIHLFVSSFDEPFTETENVIYFGKGLHNADNSGYINSLHTVNLTSNTTVYIERGAVVQAKFTADHADNIKIIGNGIIDGSVFERDAAAGKVTVPLDFNYCTDVTLKDFSVLDPAGWCVNFYFNQNSTIDNIKIITSRSNGDGISIQSCKDILVQNCFVRSWDDSLVVKNYPEWSSRQSQGSTDNIRFVNCILWTDLAQCMEIGYETVGKQMENITFQNITVLHAFHKPVISIHNGNNADIKNASFIDITVEDAQMGLGDAGSSRQLIDFSTAYSSTWSDQHTKTELGSIEDVVVRNINVLKGGKRIPIAICGSFDKRSGYQTAHYIKGITIEDVSIKGEVLKADYPYLTTNQYTEDVHITSSGNEVTGAKFIFTQTEEELNQFNQQISIIQ